MSVTLLDSVAIMYFKITERDYDCEIIYTTALQFESHTYSNISINSLWALTFASEL